jgi:hypothetical protein
MDLSRDFGDSEAGVDAVMGLIGFDLRWQPEVSSFEEMARARF